LIYHKTYLTFQVGVGSILRQTGNAEKKKKERLGHKYAAAAASSFLHGSKKSQIEFETLGELSVRLVFNQVPKSFLLSSKFSHAVSVKCGGE
jgi:hypothetical protein